MVPAEQKEGTPMSTLVSRNNAVINIPAFADALYRLTGLSYFSAESRARRAQYEQP